MHFIYKVMCHHMIVSHSSETSRGEKIQGRHWHQSSFHTNIFARDYIERDWLVYVCVQNKDSTLYSYFMPSFHILLRESFLLLRFIWLAAKWKKKEAQKKQKRTTRRSCWGMYPQMVCFSSRQDVRENEGEVLGVE